MALKGYETWLNSLPVAASADYAKMLQCAHYLLSKKDDSYMTTRDWIYLTFWDYSNIGDSGSGWMKCEMYSGNRHPSAPNGEYGGRMYYFLNDATTRSDCGLDY